MIASMDRYASVIFDCDGVVLDSNKIKTDGFRAVASRFGDEIAEQLVAFHVENGGVSRFVKFRHLKEVLLQGRELDVTVEELCLEYGRYVINSLLVCEVAAGLQELRIKHRDQRWFVVSGGAQDELRQIFSARGLANYFDGGIFGSPDSKDVILDRLISSGQILLPAIFIGDSRYDHAASSRAGLDFIFLHKWTEVSDWAEFCSSNGVSSIAELAALI